MIIEHVYNRSFAVQFSHLLTFEHLVDSEIKSLFILAIVSTVVEVSKHEYEIWIVTSYMTEHFRL
jgi:hypothetical protein